MLPSPQPKMIEKAKLTYSSLKKAFEKQRKAINEERETT